MFRMIGEDPNRRFGSPPAPENVVNDVLGLTGARLLHPPRFVRRGWDWFPHYGWWHMEFERPVEFQTTQGERVASRRLFVDRDGSWAVQDGTVPGPVMAGVIPV